jgi:hypothetical protein
MKTIQYYGKPEDKRAMRLIYEDQELRKVLICEHRRGQAPVIEIWQNTVDKNIFFEPRMINIIGAYRGFASELTESQFVEVYNTVSAALLEFGIGEADDE